MAAFNETSHLLECHEVKEDADDSPQGKRCRPDLAPAVFHSADDGGDALVGLDEGVGLSELPEVMGVCIADVRLAVLLRCPDRLFIQIQE